MANYEPSNAALEFASFVHPSLYDQRLSTDIIRLRNDRINEATTMIKLSPVARMRARSQRSGNGQVLETRIRIIGENGAWLEVEILSSVDFK